MAARKKRKIFFLKPETSVQSDCLSQWLTLHALFKSKGRGRIFSQWRRRGAGERRQCRQRKTQRSGQQFGFVKATWILNENGLLE